MKAPKNTWYIAHNEKDVYHAGFSKKGTQIDSGQPELETFDNEADWKARCKQLGIEDET